MLLFLNGKHSKSHESHIEHGANSNIHNVSTEREEEELGKKCSKIY